MHPPRRPPSRHRWTFSDDYVAEGRVWRPESAAPIEVFIYLHGIQSHGGWFEHSAAILAGNDAAVVLPDRRGSGLNEAARGDVAHRDRWLADLDELHAWCRAEFGVDRVSVVGVSWGGKLAAAWASRHPPAITRMALIAPGIFPSVDIGILGRLRVGAQLFTRSATPVPIPLSDPALFTRNPAGQRFIAEDPLKLTHATARFLYHSTLLDRELRRLPAGSLETPTLLILAEHDRIIRNVPTAEWLERVAAKRASITRIEGADHTFELADNMAEFDALLETWRVPAAPAATVNK